MSEINRKEPEICWPALKMSLLLDRKMNKDEFIKLSVKCGYSNKAAAENYVKENPKEEYTTDDFIALHNKSMHWEGCRDDKGLLPMYGINGRTTAKRNGVADDYGTGQDWR